MPALRRLQNEDAVNIQRVQSTDNLKNQLLFEDVSSQDFLGFEFDGKTYVLMVLLPSDVVEFVIMIRSS